MPAARISVSDVCSLKIAIFTAILFIAEKIIYDLKYIMLFTLIALFGALALEKESEHLEAKAKKVQEGIEEAEKQMTKDAYIEEKKQAEEKKIKIKIKK